MMLPALRYGTYQDRCVDISNTDPPLEKKKETILEIVGTTLLSMEEKNEKPIAIWGLESLQYRKDIIVITEGVFDAVRFHNYNIPAVALLSSSYKPYKNWLLSLGRKIYKCEDESGSGLGPFPNIECPEKDFGECSVDQMDKIIRENFR